MLLIPISAAYSVDKLKILYRLDRKFASYLKAILNYLKPANDYLKMNNDLYFYHRIKSFTWHFFAIGLYMAFEIIAQMARSGKFSNMEIYVIFYLCDIGYLYLSSYKLLPGIYARFSSRFRRLLAGSLVVLTNSVFLVLVNTALLSYYMHHWLFKITSADLLLSFLRSFFIFFISFALWENRFRVLKEDEIAERKNRELLLENEVLRLENELLRSQINPHMLNNSLTSIYSRILKESPELAEIIQAWVEITNYSFAKSDENGCVSLQDELEYLTKFITLQRALKYNKINIDLYVKTDGKSFSIPPLLFLEIVENMIKYGYLLDGRSPGLIQVYQEGAILDFRSWNLKAKQVKEPTSRGFGLKNLRVRLKKYFHNNHELTINETETEFEVVLKLQL